MASPRRSTKRLSGESAADETAREVSASESGLPGEGLDNLWREQEKWRTPGFSRMRVDWRSEDRPIIDEAKAVVDGRILAKFQDAYLILNGLYDVVRDPELDSLGNPKKDMWGWNVWRQGPDGGYIEDFTRLTRAQKEHYLFLITTRLLDWEQSAADAWGEAMFAKAQWEERFSIGFDKPLSGTVDDRTASGRLEARDERYFAIFLTWYSRRSDALVRIMQLLGQRLKDSLTG